MDAAMIGALSVLMWVGLAVCGGALYLLPTIVTLGRRDIGDMAAVVVIVNVMLGWTGVGWVLAMLLAAPEPQQEAAR